ncbi:MAG: NfeD family protein [Bdellovibrionales bacterium]
MTLRLEWILVLFGILMGFRAQAACTIAVNIQDSIGAATYDIFQRAQEKAKEQKCSSIFVRLNTPGGHLHSTRLITELILASPQPFLCLISPVGGHAGSAGAIILQACHVSGGLTATNLGAATPVAGQGQELPQDLRNKMINDTVSWLEGMTELRGRNKDFSRQIITEGKAVTTEEAVRLKALDIAATTEAEFLQKAEGRSVLDFEKKKSEVTVGTLVELPLDIRYQVLQFISEPEWAYLFFLGALLLLYAEFSNPGLIVPGVAGAILLILALISFHKLEANYGGMALMLLGLAFWVAELFITSKGILGIAGTLSFLLGSFLLFDEGSVGFDVPTRLILTAALVFGGLSGSLAYLAARSLGRPAHDYDEQMRETKLRILELDSSGRSGRVEALGEIWNFETESPVQPSDELQIKERKNLKLILEKKTSRRV